MWRKPRRSLSASLSRPELMNHQQTCAPSWLFPQKPQALLSTLGLNLSFPHQGPERSLHQTPYPTSVLSPRGFLHFLTPAQTHSGLHSPQESMRNVCFRILSEHFLAQINIWYISLRNNNPRGRRISYRKECAFQIQGKGSWLGHQGPSAFITIAQETSCL